MLKTYK